MGYFVEFGDFVEEWACNVTVTLHGTRDTYDDNGRLVKGQDFDPKETRAIILPLSNDEVNKVDNGRYTEHDRKVYILEPLKMGTVVTYESEQYTIDREMPQAAYTDVYRYYAKGKGKGYE